VNSALRLVAIVRMTHDGETRESTEKRRAEGRTDKEIRHCIKRYLARRIDRAFSAFRPSPTERRIPNRRHGRQ
jgi:transposase